MEAFLALYERYRHLSFWDVVPADDGNYWTVGYWDNALYQVNLEEGTAKWICYLPEDDEYKEIHYSFLALYKNRLFALPENTFKIAVYDLLDEQLNKVEICEKFHGKYCGYDVIGSVQFQNQLVLVSGMPELPAVILNCDTLSYTMLPNGEELKKEYYTGSGIFVYTIAQYKNQMIVGIRNTNFIIGFNLINYQYSRFLTLPSNMEIDRIYCDKDILWIVLLGKDYILKKNLSEDEDIQRIKILDTPNDGTAIVSMIMGEDIVVVIPRYGKVIYIIDKQTDSIRKCDCTDESFISYVPESNRYFARGRIDENYVYLYPYRTNAMVQIDKYTLEKKYVLMDIDVSLTTDEIMEKYYGRYRMRMIQHETICSLNSFISNLPDKREGIYSLQTSGAGIWKKLLEG